MSENQGYSGTSKKMIPNKLPGTGKPIWLTGYWQSLRRCKECGKKMWENGKQTRCICELKDYIEEKGEKSMPKTLNERVMEMFKSDFSDANDNDSIIIAADEISARIGGTSAIVVLSIIRDNSGIKAKKPEKSHNLNRTQNHKPGRKSTYTAEELQSIVDMYNVGCSDGQIGAEVGRSGGTISVKLSALRKKGLIGLRTSHKKAIGSVEKKPEKVSQVKPEGKTAESPENSLAGSPPDEPAKNIPQPEPKQVKEMTTKEIGNIHVWLNITAGSEKPTLGQFIDFAAKCGYALKTAAYNGGEGMEFTFYEVGEVE